MSISEVRAALPALLTRVEEGEEVTVTRHGKAIAVMVRPDVLRRRRNAAIFEEAAKVRQMLEEARQRPLPDLTKGGLSREFGESLIREIREGRDSRP